MLERKDEKKEKKKEEEYELKVDDKDGKIECVRELID
jgi:hypothetical protein